MLPHRPTLFRNTYFPGSSGTERRMVILRGVRAAHAPILRMPSKATAGIRLTDLSTTQELRAFFQAAF